MKKNILNATLLVLILISSLTINKFRKEINAAKNYLVEKETYRRHKVTNPLTDKIPRQNDELVFGLDVSHHQRHINWDKVAQSPPHFIIFKATEGSTHVDTKYEEHIVEARKIAITVGAYHFFSYQSSGEKQAQHFLKHIKLQNGDLIPVLDVEFKNKMNSDAWIKENIQSFIATLESEISIKPIIYCEIAYYNRFLKPFYGDDLKLWLSDFSRKPKNEFVIWQNTDKYKQAGIKGTVDYNLFNGSKKEFNAILYSN